MRKSIYAYWTVFCFRYVDNLHQRIKHNLLFDFADKIILIIGQRFMPNGGSEYSERVKQWMNEPRDRARQREELSHTLEKIEKCLTIVNEMSLTSRRGGRDNTEQQNWSRRSVSPTVNIK